MRDESQPAPPSAERDESAAEAEEQAKEKRAREALERFEAAVPSREEQKLLLYGAGIKQYICALERFKGSSAKALKLTSHVLANSFYLYQRPTANELRPHQAALEELLQSHPYLEGLTYPTLESWAIDKDTARQARADKKQADAAWEEFRQATSDHLYGRLCVFSGLNQFEHSRKAANPTREEAESSARFVVKNEKPRLTVAEIEAHRAAFAKLLTANPYFARDRLTVQDIIDWVTEIEHPAAAAPAPKTPAVANQPAGQTPAQLAADAWIEEEVIIKPAEKAGKEATAETSASQETVVAGEADEWDEGADTNPEIQSPSAETKDSGAAEAAEPPLEEAERQQLDNLIDIFLRSHPFTTPAVFTAEMLRRVAEGVSLTSAHLDDWPVEVIEYLAHEINLAQFRELLPTDDEYAAAQLAGEVAESDAERQFVDEALLPLIAARAKWQPARLSSYLQSHHLTLNEQLRQLVQILFSEEEVIESVETPAAPASQETVAAVEAKNVETGGETPAKAAGAIAPGRETAAVGESVERDKESLSAPALAALKEEVRVLGDKFHEPEKLFRDLQEYFGFLNELKENLQKIEEFLKRDKNFSEEWKSAEERYNLDVLYSPNERVWTAATWTNDERQSFAAGSWIKEIKKGKVGFDTVKLWGLVSGHAANLIRTGPVFRLLRASGIVNTFLTAGGDTRWQRVGAMLKEAEKSARAAMEKLGLIPTPSPIGDLRSEIFVFEGSVLKHESFEFNKNLDPAEHQKEPEYQAWLKGKPASMEYVIDVPWWGFNCVDDRMRPLGAAVRFGYRIE